MLDWFFYDVDGLTVAERAQLVRQANVQGAIVVVWPKGALGPVSYRKFPDAQALRAAGDLAVSRFSIAGVGSSDVGAAAFARTVADHVGEPVGAIVAGYGAADLLSEAMGGWFVLGGANRVLQMYQDAVDAQGAGANLAEPPQRPASVDHREDSATLVQLLSDPDQPVSALYAHSKGCLSITYAMDALLNAGAGPDLARQAGVQITTVGTVIRLPRALTQVQQYLGELDWFGGMNSQRDLDYVTIPGALHHLNSAVPGHLDFAELLRGEYG